MGGQVGFPSEGSLGAIGIKRDVLEIPHSAKNGELHEEGSSKESHLGPKRGLKTQEVTEEDVLPDLKVIICYILDPASKGLICHLVGKVFARKMA